MGCLHFLIIFGLSCVFLPCKGQIISPPDGSEFFVLNGSNVRIEWSLQSGLTINYRSWSFKRNSNSSVFLGSISSTGTIDVATKLYDVDIEEPATLVLNNVNASYEGTYEFTLITTGPTIYSVGVIVPVKPIVSINCSDPTTVNETLDLTCGCRSEGGNPPANLTWYHENGTQIGNTSYGENVLTLPKVTKQDSGRYTCKGQSYILIDEKSFELVVYYKPSKAKIKVPDEAYIGKNEKFTITCSSDGLPAPSVEITHNGTIMIGSNKTIVTYTKDNVQYNDAGMYTCTAKNLLGNVSASGILTVKEKRAPTKPTTPIKTTQPPVPSKTSERTTDNGGGGGLSGGAIAGICVGSGLLVVIVVVVVYCCSKSKEKDGRNRGNIDPAAGNHYELENEDAGPADNAYDSVGPVGTSSGKSKPPEKNTLPPVYAAVDKNNRQGNTLYASLDTDAMKPKRESKKEPERTPQTEYASIDFAKRADDNVPKADLV